MAGVLCSTLARCPMILCTGLCRICAVKSHAANLTHFATSREFFLFAVLEFMRVGAVLLVAAASILACVGARQDASNTKLTPSNNAKMGRYLRAYEAATEDIGDANVDLDKEDRMNLSPEAKNWLAKMLTMSDD
ncbi:unnamed protein product [Phytophthora fragariaefolia]|uniref:RxLR effector protein n=1 Tax=Phytophthora fragariaefolia TaxID=1490495 RepID=A0A9W6WZL6_9STRA|nr:unnamed protein product [Phytophthora fragariaefolia]